MTPSVAVPPRALVFDWDNTLVDSWHVIHAALNEMLPAMGHDPWTLAETKQRVGLSLRDAFPALFGERWSEARERYHAAFEARHLDALTPLPGAASLVRDLAAAGYPLGVVSNKTGRFLRAEVAQLGWGDCFLAVVGAGDVARDKPAPDPVTAVLAAGDLTPDDSVWFVGDSAVDLECAHATGCHPVLLRPEPPAPGEFVTYPPARHYADAAALGAAVLTGWVPSGDE